MVRCSRARCASARLPSSRTLAASAPAVWLTRSTHSALQRQKQEAAVGHRSSEGMWMSAVLG